MSTEPYYQDELVTLYHGDCLELAHTWAGADVLVTDPPYGIAYRGFGGRRGRPRQDRQLTTLYGDRNTQLRDAALQAWGDGPALVFGKWTMPRPEGTRMRLIWDKTPCGFMGDTSLPWGPVEEEVYVLGKGFSGRRRGNIIRHQTLLSRDRSRPKHPTPKPLPLMRELLELCPPGIVADPFVGSGATMLAAAELGRSAVGVELDESYCEITATRLEDRANGWEDLL